MSDNYLGEWMQNLDGIFERNRREAKDRITRFKQEAGKPHATIIVGDDPEYQDHVGFWRVEGGVIRIKARHNGDFDPADRTDITLLELEALSKAYNHVNLCDVLPDED